MKVQLRQISPSASEATVGASGHKATIDRPVAKGGGDAGPMGGELFLASVGGCFMSTLLAAIRARDAAISDVRIEVTGTLADAPTRFSAIELQVTGETADPDLLDKLTLVANNGCIMMNTLRGALDLKVHATQSHSL